VHGWRVSGDQKEGVFVCHAKNGLDCAVRRCSCEQSAPEAELEGVRKGC